MNLTKTIVLYKQKKNHIGLQANYSIRDTSNFNFSREILRIKVEFLNI